MQGNLFQVVELTRIDYVTVLIISISQLVKYEMNVQLNGICSV